MNAIKRLSRHYDSLLLEKIVYMPPVDEVKLHDIAAMRDWFNELQARTNASMPAGQRFEITLDDTIEQGTFLANMVKLTHGIVASEQRLAADFFATAEYERMRDLGQQLDGLLSESAYIRRGERQQPVSSFKEAVSWMMEQAKRGQQIQRYKGLGEMNPDQLWETTMNPDTRRMLQVQIEDAVAADQIFTTLMGDQVEPRRDFIESNALAANNLDV